ncbi:hypothetical protein LZY01_15710 [Levilactobacillus zymae]|uniref:FeoB-associated Cys-rich membrane protein n=1 Tax=Levilactobacillus zymae TaxID=267363 RepID=A0ABQ0WXR6_9LACO|nr:FeoB-associated Cys-rich membrane protein [Levilactobacillus zymae]QFR61994.1 FeoB-associated Cys-rich membrane protein [Levilactobacillus zymae]GEO72403.1 hypothetical protein LZY01_15710 [Levilactobacillus zymae]
MSLLINLVIAAAIVGFAGYEIYKSVKRSKGGGCNACDYQCDTKEMLKQHSSKLN